jgi:MOSC domain-containing protein YiiM
MRLLSVNVGHPQPNPWKTMKLTGIDKRPVDGPVMVTRPRAAGMGMLTIEPDLLPRLLVADALPGELKDLARRRTA